jgi:hypothetical protein
MALVVEDLTDKILEAMNEVTKSVLTSNNDKTDEELAESDKVRVEYEDLVTKDKGTFITTASDLSSLEHLPAVGQAIVDYIMENTEFIYSYKGTVTVGNTTIPDLLTSTTGKIISIENLVVKNYPSLPALLIGIQDSITTAVIELDKPDEFFLPGSTDEFGPVIIPWAPTADNCIDNIKDLATKTITGVKSAISTKIINCTHTITGYTSSTGTAEMITIL